MTLLSDAGALPSDVEVVGSDSWLRPARVAGLLYLVVIVGGLFAEVGVRGWLIIPDGPAATLTRIASFEGLWRWGIAVHLVYLVAAVAVDVILYRLFKPVGATLAVLALALSLLDVAIEAVNLLLLHIPLTILSENAALTSLGADARAATTFVALEIFSTGFSVALLFFAGFCVTNGLLLRRTQRAPAAIGPMMILAGLCYSVNSLAFTLAPSLSDRLVPWILLPCLVGESSFAFWLAARGRLDSLNVEPEPAEG